MLHLQPQTCSTIIIIAFYTTQCTIKNYISSQIELKSDENQIKARQDARCPLIKQTRSPYIITAPDAACNSMENNRL